MEKLFRKCENAYVNNNLFYLNNNDIVYEYLINNNVVGYGLVRDSGYDMIRIYIDKNYENNHYGSELFKYMINLIDKDIYISVNGENIKMNRIIRNNNGIEIGRNNRIYTYLIKRKNMSLIDNKTIEPINENIKFKEFYIDFNGKSNCVIRSLCKALNKEYEEVYNDLLEISKELNKSFNDIPVFEKYMSNNNINKIIEEEIKIKNLKLSNGTYIVFCYDKKDFYHMIPIIDNVIYDKNKDCIDLYTISIYKKNN